MLTVKSDSVITISMLDKRGKNQMNSNVNNQEGRNILAWGRGKTKQEIIADGKRKQNKLYDTRVLVVGSGPLAQMTLGCLVGLGIGHILIMSDSRISNDDNNEFLCYKKDNRVHYTGNMKAVRITETLKKIDLSRDITARFAYFTPALAYGFSPQMVVDATNDPFSKESCLDYARKYHIPFISASTDQHKGIVSSYQPIKNKALDSTRDINLERLVHKEFKDMRQGSFTSSIIGGLIADEVRKNVFRISDGTVDEPLRSDEVVTYNFNSGDRTNLKNGKSSIYTGYNSVNALVVGAGALGNFVVLNLALAGFGHVDIIDYDIVETHNLARQILLYERIGEPKAKVLSKRLRKINPNCKSSYFLQKFTRNDERLIAEGNGNRRYDIVFSCVDLYTPRYWLNEYCVKHKVPLINGGTDSIGGHSNAYYPGLTYCIGCKESLEEKAKNDPDNNSCANDPAPSQIVPNIIIAGAMAGEGLKVTNPKNDNVLSGTFSYDSLMRGKIQVIPPLIIGNITHNCKEAKG